LKQFYIHPTIVEICYVTFQHVNKEGLVRGLVKSGLGSTFSIHVSKDTWAFVLEHFQLGFFCIYQVMNKHKSLVKEMIERNGELSRDLFLNEQNIRNMVGKLAKKMYNKHENDAQSVCMWMVGKKNNVFFYQETNVEVDDGGCQSHNMPLTIGIQIEWQHGHENGVSIDATCRTNEQKVWDLNKILTSIMN